MKLYILNWLKIYRIIFFVYARKFSSERWDFDVVEYIVWLFAIVPSKYFSVMKKWSRMVIIKLRNSPKKEDMGEYDHRQPLVYFHKFAVSNKIIEEDWIRQKMKI